jgi:hypothetical protein
MAKPLRSTILVTGKTSWAALRSLKAAKIRIYPVGAVRSDEGSEMLGQAADELGQGRLQHLMRRFLDLEPP